MSNGISVRRVKFQDIDKQGNHIDEPTFGIIAVDDINGDYADLWRTLNDLNQAIESAGSMLSLLDKDFGVDADNPVFLDNYEGPKPAWPNDKDEEDDSCKRF